MNAAEAHCTHSCQGCMTCFFIVLISNAHAYLKGSLAFAYSNEFFVTAAILRQLKSLHTYSRRKARSA